ncbi:MAG: glycosyltransferase family 39 protein [Thermoanaerobaculia bacterium]
MNDRGLRWLLVGTLTVFLYCQALAVGRQSLTMDEPYHLLAGDQALRTGTNSLNYEHPPLVKLVAALPLLSVESPWPEPVPLRQALERAPDLFRSPALANRVRVEARALLVLAFALPWLLACYALGRELGGKALGTALAVVLGLSSMAIPFLSLVQTDAAVALGYALTLLAGLRFAREPTRRYALALGAALGLALAAKFSGLLLAPAVLAVLFWPGGAVPSSRLARAFLALGTALLVAALPYAVANRRYQRAEAQESIRTYCSGQGTLVVGDRLAGEEGRLLALERASPGLAQAWLGVSGIRIQNALGVYPYYAFGKLSSKGRWWYFPALLAVKTPLAILLASAAAFLAWLRGRRGEVASRLPPAAQAMLWLGGGVYLAFALAGNYNLGSRHLLPVLPLLYLPAARWAAERPRRLSALFLVLAVEALWLAPGWMSATNTWWLGEANPSRFALGGGDTEYKQNFLELAREAERRGIERLGVVFPGTGTAEIAASIPGAVAVAPGEPLAPGWYAVTVLAEQSVPGILAARPEELFDAERYRALAEAWRPLLAALAAGEDHGYLAGSFHLYRLPGPSAPSASTLPAR